VIQGWACLRPGSGVLGACDIWIVLAWVHRRWPRRRDRPSARRKDRTPSGMYLRKRCQVMEVRKDLSEACAESPAALGRVRLGSTA